MSKNQDDFFKAKKPWSIIKDNMLGYYLSPYISKLLTTKKPLHYFDCFAGKGVFDDGNAGSPIIALDAIDKALSKTKMIAPTICTYFIECNYADDLIRNLNGRSYTRVVNGKFEENINKLLEQKENENVFLYIDPYGIKYLDMCWLNNLIKAGFSSVELLINFNSHGFFRVACKALGVRYIEGDSEDIDDFDFYYYFKDSKNVDLLNTVAGGDYWKKIVLDYREEKITGSDAEIEISKKYCRELMKHYHYVLDLPIRQKNSRTTKYRMIHATRHAAGCLLMVDTIYKQKENLTELQRAGQLTLFNETSDFEYVDSAQAKKFLLDYISSLIEWTSKEVVYATYYVEHGLLCKPENLDSYLREFEENGQISVLRVPALKKNQKPSKFYTVNTKQKVLLRRG